MCIFYEVLKQLESLRQTLAIRIRTRVQALLKHARPLCYIFTLAHNSWFVRVLMVLKLAAAKQVGGSYMPRV